MHALAAASQAMHTVMRNNYPAFRYRPAGIVTKIKETMLDYRKIPRFKTGKVSGTPATGWIHLIQGGSNETKTYT